MSDRLHDHTTIVIRRGCVACAQFEADFALAARAYREANPDLYVKDTSRAHPDLRPPLYPRPSRV